MAQRLPNEDELLRRITVDPKIFGGKPIVRGRRLAVEQVLGMPAGGDSVETFLAGYPWLEAEDVRACLEYARRSVERQRVEPTLEETNREAGHASDRSHSVVPPTEESPEEPS